MLIGRVVSNVWATRKEESLTGFKFMITEIFDTLNDFEEADKGQSEKRKIIVAADFVGAGIGEKVLICNGSSARLIGGLQETPIDAAIIAIIDEQESTNSII